MKKVALLEDSYLFRKLQSDQLIAEGLYVLVCSTVSELLEKIVGTDFDLILVDRYHIDQDYDAFADKFGIILKEMGVTCPIVLWTNLKLPAQDLRNAGFDGHAAKTLYAKAELQRMIELEAV